MSDDSSLSRKYVPLLLLSIPALNQFGLDKLYLGLYGQFGLTLLLLILSLAVHSAFGILLMIWITYCFFGLLFAIATNTSPSRFVYPNVKGWKPNKTGEYVMLFISIFLFILSIVTIISIYRAMNNAPVRTLNATALSVSAA